MIEGKFLNITDADALTGCINVCYGLNSLLSLITTHETIVFVFGLAFFTAVLQKFLIYKLQDNVKLNIFEIGIELFIGISSMAYPFRLS